MCVACSVTYSAVGLGLLVGSSPLVAVQNNTQATTASFSSSVVALQTLPEKLGAVKAATAETPTWLKEKRAKAAANTGSGSRSSNDAATMTVTYDVTSRGGVTASMAEFRSQANATLNDSRGWSRMGVTFKEVASGGMFTLVLSTSEQMTSFSSGCGTEYSCRAGRFVIINQDRWMGATSSWNSGGGSRRDYRHMVVNHETGHWLGHDHAYCGGAGQPAPVMQQQSMGLQGCKFNPWPTKSELWSTQLGIR